MVFCPKGCLTEYFFLLNKGHLPEKFHLADSSFDFDIDMAKIEKSLEGPTLGSCHGTSKLKIKNPFYQIQVHVLK
jgi:hypothetical protein